MAGLGRYPRAMQWLARGELSVPRDWDWLTAAEAGRARSMRFTKRRTEYLLRRFSGKCAVAATVGLSEASADLARIAVLNRPTGAPYVEVDGAPLGLDVSLTDRAGWAVCLVGSDLAAVGCDLEIVEPRSRGFVRDFLTAPEQQAVARTADLAEDGWDAAANLIWSAKESALKVLRTGLRADTRTVEVSVGDPAAVAGAGAGWQPLVVATSSARFPGWWRRDGSFLLTVVAADTAALARPPDALAGSDALEAAEPIHTWLANPVLDE